MEKLQAALHKARQFRDAQPSEHISRQITKPDQPSRDVVDLWSKLKPLNVDDAVLERNRILTRAASSAAAPFDILRTKVLLQMRQNGWRRLAITSPTPQSGKSTTACNLALGLGRQRELRSILMDLDLRDPSVHRFFDIAPSAGIGNVLSGDLRFADQAMRLGDNVAISMAQRPEIDPTRLLLAEETEDILQEIEDSYQPDLMIFDLPSVLVNDDTRAFLKNVDCALIVARANVTRYEQFDQCEREVAEQTNVVGVVLNAYDTPKDG